LSFSAFAPQADPFFRAQVVRPGDGNSVTLEAAFAVTVVTQGGGSLVTGDGPDRTSQQIAAGDVLLIPHGAGEVRVEGDVTAIRCMPPGGAG
jgi:mannose-6-phosphate isomerase